MIFPGFPGVPSFFQVFQVEWEPCDVMPGLGAVGGPCFRPVAGEPPEEGLLLPLSETKKQPQAHTHISKHQDTNGLHHSGVTDVNT